MTPADALALEVTDLRKLRRDANAGRTYPKEMPTGHCGNTAMYDVRAADVLESLVMIQLRVNQLFDREMLALDDGG